MDNRLTWLLGRLEYYYGNSAIYIHMKRDKKETAKSFLRRFKSQQSIIKAYKNGILKSAKDHYKKIDYCEDYVDTVNSNIELFLKDKGSVMEFHLENAVEDFKKFWHFIEAKGDFNKAIKTWEQKFNVSKKHKSKSVK
jgi:hypothetical protein